MRETERTLYITYRPSTMNLKVRIRLEIEIEIGLEFNQLKERKSISNLVNFVLIDQNLIQSQSQSVV